MSLSSSRTDVPFVEKCDATRSALIGCSAALETCSSFLGFLAVSVSAAVTNWFLLDPVSRLHLHQNSLRRVRKEDSGREAALPSCSALVGIAGIGFFFLGGVTWCRVSAVEPLAARQREAFQRPSSEPLYCCPCRERRGRNARLVLLLVGGSLYLED